MVEYYPTVCAYHTLFIHSSADEPKDCFHLFALVNSAPVNVCVYTYLFESLFAIILGPGMLFSPFPTPNLSSYPRGVRGGSQRQ